MSATWPPSQKFVDGADDRRASRAFLLLWLIVPTAFRAIILGIAPAPIDQTSWPFLGRALVAGFVQDLAIACQVWLLVAIIKSCLPVRGGYWTSVVVAGLLFVVVQFYLLMDFLLFLNTGIRMTPSFLAFLPVAVSFFSSVAQVGLGTLLLGGVGILIAIALTWRSLTRNLRQLRFSWPLALFTPLAIFGGGLAQSWLPAELGYAANNRVASDQLSLVTHWIGPPPLSELEQRVALALLTPKAEMFERVDPRYPLLKHTKRFEGEKQFDLDIAPGERPHVVFLFLESFRARDIGALGGKHNASPNFDRLSSEGVLFTDFYGAGVQTTRGVIASLFGIPPWFEERAVHSAHPEMPLIGVADLFNARGYTSAYISGNSLEFEGKQDFFPAHGYAEVLGQDDVASKLPDAQGTSWGQHDEYLVEYFVDWLAEKDARDQPTFSTVFTISHHHPWYVPDGYKAPQFDTGANAEYARFLQTFHYTDHCLGMLVDKLKQQGLDKKTILFVMADTATPQGEHNDNFMLVKYLYEENVHIPLLILAPGRINEPKRIDDVASQVDLMPTVMDLLDMQGVNHAVGTTLVRKVEGRTAYFNNPFALACVGFRRGNWKYVYNITSGESELYNLKDDPNERFNLAGEMAGSVIAEWGLDSTLVHRFMSELYESRGLLWRK